MMLSVVFIAGVFMLPAASPAKDQLHGMSQPAHSEFGGYGVGDTTLDSSLKSQMTGDSTAHSESHVRSALVNTGMMGSKVKSSVAGSPKQSHLQGTNQGSNTLSTEKMLPDHP
ncbi:uncharacterized protein [Cherax quadricarinatus]|uniref:uncharacterized protein n=1 Tax=Cherax quadricarinatus TaxID=27406 RepID=UPI00387EBD5C